MNISKLRHTMGLLRTKHAKPRNFVLSPTTDRRFVLIGTPHHGNLGDHAIAFAEVEFLKSIHPNAALDIVTESDYWKFKSSLSKQLKKDDVILLHGGGNVGNLYPYAEAVRQDVLKRFKTNPAVMFPQTVHFTSDSNGLKAKRTVAAVYKNKSHFVAFARESVSALTLAELVGDSRAFLVPDIALSLTYLLPFKQKRSGALLCLRNDIEKTILEKEEALIAAQLSRRFSSTIKTDTVVPEFCSFTAAEQHLRELLLRFASAELIITDRLHGMIFAALTRTPCIALPNFNHKINGVAEWLSDMPFICYLKDISELNSVTQSVLTADQNADRAFAMLSASFDPLRKVLECL